MKAFLSSFLITALLASFAASAAERALFVNMNYSVQEWKAFRDSSRACGREPISVPDEKFLALGESVFTQRDALERKIRALRPSWKKNELQNAIVDIMREGPAWKEDANLAQQLSTEIDYLYRSGQALDKVEREQGTVAEQLKRRVEELRRRGDEVTSISFSAHSDGWNLTGESANRLSGTEIESVLKENPKVFRHVQQVLLLGCYNMTGNNRQHWRSLFPYATLMGGFGRKAPSRTREIAWKFISDLACALDEKMATEGRPLDPAFVREYFKKLASVRGTESVIDYCYQIVEGQPTPPLSCDEQWTIFLAQAEQIQDQYLDLGSLKKDPPAADSATSELRLFYNVLQGTCPANESPQMSSQVREAEAYRRSFRENVIRLIFWWRVQKNFQTYYAKEISALDRSLQAAGVKMEVMAEGGGTRFVPAQVPSLDGSLGRVHFVGYYNTIQRGIASRKRELAMARARRLSDAELAQVNAAQKLVQKAEQDFKILYPLYSLQGEQTIGERADPSVEETLQNGAIPFNWIEGTVYGGRGQ